METAPLKSFATWARKALIDEVNARVKIVLAPASPERVERPGVVSALERAVSAAGGGETGRAAVADRVAYTWFNRVIALRFMDANGYTGIGVVSPQAGTEGGQPEILAEAKRGNIDAAIAGAKTSETVTGLLNGSRRSDDPQGEAYALLLAEYCRHWNRTMPFMFEREGDFTELLIPANLLADDSILNRAVKVLTTDVCRDVEVIGWLYQFYISERKDEVFAGFKKGKKAGTAEIPAATQLFTPHWIVRYLVENSLGRLWMLNRPASRLIDQMEYYIAPVDEETDFLKVSGPEELTIIDPACGSGHMLTYAFDLLYAIYEEAGYAPSDIPSLILSKNLHGTEIDPRAGALAAFALTMKARARQRTFFNRQVEPNICVLEPTTFTPQEVELLVTPTGDRFKEAAFWNQFRHADTFGSLIRPDTSVLAALRAHVETIDVETDLIAADAVSRAKRVIWQSEVLSSGYLVVVANPPYMGNKTMGPQLAEFARTEYPDSKTDLFAIFIELCERLASPHGFVGMITMQSWMFLDSFNRLRSNLLQVTPLASMAHLGAHAFDTIGGEVVSTTAFVREMQGDSHRPAIFVRLVDVMGEDEKGLLFKRAIGGNSGERLFVASSASLRALPQSVVAYSMPTETRNLFQGKRIADLAHVHRGISTGNNDLYMRHWYEVSRSQINIDATSQNDTLNHRWYRVNRGSYPTRWYGYGPEILDYKGSGRRMIEAARQGDNPGFRHDGFAEYFKETITWSAMTSGTPLFRLLPAGFVIGHKGPGIAVSHERRYWLLALLNSTPSTRILRQLSGTLDILVGQIQQLPLPGDQERGRVESLANKLISFYREKFAQREDSIEFIRHPLLTDYDLQGASAAERLHQFLELEASAWQTVVSAEDEIDDIFTQAYGLPKSEQHFKREAPQGVTDFESVVSYAVGCMFGRYSLDRARPDPRRPRRNLAGLPRKGSGARRFMPDADNVIPIVDGDWFEDDIVARFRRVPAGRVRRAALRGEPSVRYRVARGEGPAGLLREVLLQGPRAAVQEAADLLALLQPEGFVQRADLHAPLHAVDRLDGAERVPAGVPGEAEVQPGASRAACCRRWHAARGGGGSEGGRPAAQGAGGTR